MTTTKLIELLQGVEKGASGRSREISIIWIDEAGNGVFISEPEISINSTGDGVAGAELCLNINGRYNDMEVQRELGPYTEKNIKGVKVLTEHSTKKMEKFIVIENQNFYNQSGNSGK